MLAILKLIPLKDWLYCALGAAILTGFVAYTVHERHEGAAKIVLADKKLADTVAAKDKIIRENAQLDLIDVGNHEKLAVNAPPIPNAGLVCHTSSSPAAASGSGSVAEPASQVAELPERSFDPSGGILTLLSDNDAQINALIDSIEILEGYIEALRLTK